MTVGSYVREAEDMRDWTPVVTGPGGTTIGALSIIRARYVARGPTIRCYLHLSFTVSSATPAYVEITQPDEIQSYGTEQTIDGFFGTDAGTGFVGAINHPTGGGNKLRFYKDEFGAVNYAGGGATVTIPASYEYERKKP